MFRLLKRRKAVKRFVYQLSLELCRHFGEKRFYSFQEIDQVLVAGKYDKVFSTYAYALFCSRKDFDFYFGPLKVNCTYDGLRKFVSKLYFSGVKYFGITGFDFNALSIIYFAKGVGDSNY